MVLTLGWMKQMKVVLNSWRQRDGQTRSLIQKKRKRMLRKMMTVMIRIVASAIPHMLVKVGSNCNLC